METGIFHEARPEVFLRLFPYATTMHRAFASGDKLRIVSFVQREFGVELHNSLVDEIIRRGQKLKSPWSDESWRMWLKNRLCEHGLLPSDSVTLPYAVGHYSSATLHIFFVHLEETKEMLTRLKNENRCEPKASRSKIFKDDSRVPYPIDSTAAIVGREKQQW